MASHRHTLSADDEGESSGLRGGQKHGVNEGTEYCPGLQADPNHRQTMNSVSFRIPSRLPPFGTRLPPHPLHPHPLLIPRHCLPSILQVDQPPAASPLLPLSPRCPTTTSTGSPSLIPSINTALDTRLINFPQITSPKINPIPLILSHLLVSSISSHIPNDHVRFNISIPTGLDNGSASPSRA